MSVTEFAMVEELAFLVRDNLRSKHLVLAMEDTFVNFLQTDTSSDGVLELEPMDPYNRLLLHRLADIFGFAHVSIGEGESRHLILERCPETSIPAILVSDILFQCDEPQSISVPDQVLRRDDATPVVQAKTPSLSTIKEREAAYLAARLRIFSVDGEEVREPVEQRPRNVPAVARRMIAHALGQKITPGRDIDWNEENKEVEESKSTSVEDSQESSSSVAKGLSRKSSSQNEMSRNRTKEFSKEEQSRAARRMFANALGLQPTKASLPTTR
ncbi:unnamed protein product [Linum trigynum]|uniref:R3H domain-containing protein n=1 Tax=Linum trigynum TaxID=586398 RepID=A0AAV2D1Z4_9ROSI